MRVNESSTVGISSLSRGDVGSSSSAPKVRGVYRDRDDQVSLSKLSGAVNALQTDSPDRSANLSSLSATVASGSYRVDPAALSGALIQNTIRA